MHCARKKHECNSQGLPIKKSSLTSHFNQQITKHPDFSLDFPRFSLEKCRCTVPKHVAPRSSDASVSKSTPPTGPRSPKMVSWADLLLQNVDEKMKILGGRCFLPQATRSYPIPMAHRVTPGQTEVTPGTKSYWHTGTTPSLVWQTKYLKCVRAIANHIFNTISFGNKTMSKVSNRHWHTHIDSKTAAFYPNEKSNQFCSTRPFPCHVSGHGFV